MSGVEFDPNEPRAAQSFASLEVLRDQVASLTDRLRSAEDRLAILETLQQTCQYMDLRVVEEWVDCFTPDAHWAYLAPDSLVPDREMRGSEQLRSFLHCLSDGTTGLDLKHHLADPVVRMGGDEAEVCSYYFTFRRTGDDSFEVRTSGRYIDHLVRSADGRWRISDRLIKMDMGQRLDR